MKKFNLEQAQKMNPNQIAMEICKGLSEVSELFSKIAEEKEFKEKELKEKFKEEARILNAFSKLYSGKYNEKT